MNRRQYQQRVRQLTEENKRYGEELVEVSPERWRDQAPPGLSRVWRSRRYLAQYYAPDSPDLPGRLTICRTAIDRNGDYLGDLSWDELQAIKDAVGFAAHDAVEIYPRQDDIVCLASMRHLWICPRLLPFAWRDQRPPAAAVPEQPDREPVPLLLFCPDCGTQHIDAPAPEQGWHNPPHKSHLCHSCQTIWRPADVPTTGVTALATRGLDDTWSPPEIWSDAQEDAA